MPNLGYLRSTKREREIVRQYKSKGWDSARSAGSHGRYDVWACDPVTGDVDLIQVKTKKGGRRVVIKYKQRTSSVVERFEVHYE